MIRTVKEGVRRYKGALRAYKNEVIRHKREREGLDPIESDDWGRILNLNNRLTAMAEVLGLTKVEERRLMAEFGIK